MRQNIMIVATGLQKMGPFHAIIWGTHYNLEIVLVEPNGTILMSESIPSIINFFLYNMGVVET